MAELAHRDHQSPIASLRNWSFGIGGLLVLLGFACFAQPLVPSLTVNFFIGGLLVAAGAVRIVSAFGTYTWKGFWLALLCGVLALVSGTAMLALPGQQHQQPPKSAPFVQSHLAAGRAGRPAA